MAPIDPHSFADGGQPSTKSVHLDLAVDFASKTLHGTATLRLDRPANGALNLDTRDLTIVKAEDGLGQPVPFEIRSPHAIKGSCLVLQLNSDEVTIAYKTSTTAMALQWLGPEQTAGGMLPYVFSQCQAIHARSIFPCQDTPQRRIQYTASLKVPADLNAVMSARHVRRDPVPGDKAWVLEVFAMEQPIPPYLFAFAVGDITSQILSPRVRVYAEPSVVQAAAEEFAGVEDWIKAAEALFGPYGWEEFNLLVMPPSFPYGGMENPRMAFLTPTLIVGDKSLVNVVAHELAHSWTGNLITNSTYAHFWLNEGWTVYAERRILEAVEGKESAVLHASIGYAQLGETLRGFEEQEAKEPGHGARFTQLDLGEEGLGDVDPDEVFSLVPYEKGYLFLRRLEEAVGRAAFDKFISSYIAKFAFGTIDTPTFLAFLTQQLPTISALVDLKAWTEAPGIPTDAPEPHSGRLDAVKLAAGAVATSPDVTETEAMASLASDDVKGWNATEKELFVRSLSRTLPRTVLAALDAKFGFAKHPNLELSTPFLGIAARCTLTPEYLTEIERILSTVGRMKYLKPLYLALKEGGHMDDAQRIYSTARPKYHPVAQSVVDGVLNKA